MEISVLESSSHRVGQDNDTLDDVFGDALGNNIQNSIN
jgi:hypothetical protein